MKTLFRVRTQAVLTVSILALLSGMEPLAATTPQTSASASNPVLPPLPVTLQVELGKPSGEIPSQFTGLSFETSLLLPDEEGKHYFDPGNKALVTLFRTLGIRSLRIGGNTGDRDFRKPPSEADIDSLFAFAKATDTKVIFCLRLLNADPQEQAHDAKYITDHYPGLIDCFSIGQEPSAYPAEKVDKRGSDERMGAANEHYPYATYATNWSRVRDAVLSAVPGAKFAGPGVHKELEWPRSFMADFGKSGRVSLLTSHLYPGGAGGKVPVPEVGRDRMLSGEFETTYENLATGLHSIAGDIPFRLEEANNFYNGGSRDASDTFTASLWGLDFLWWWASHGAAGVNFHTGNEVAAGDKLVPCKYTAFRNSPGGCIVEPLGYGIKAFGLGAAGHVVPVKLSPADNGLRAYASVKEGTLCVTVINRTYGAVARTFDFTMNIPQASGSAEFITLTSPQRNVAAKTGVTIGGSGILSNGTWTGRWDALKSSTPGKNKFSVNPSSAVILRIPLTAAE